MKKVLIILLPVLVLVGAATGYYFFTRQKAEINVVEPAACSPRYYYHLTEKKCKATGNNYDINEIDCSGGTNKTCVVNLQDFLSGKTAGSCYKTEAQCMAAYTASTTLCKPRYYYNKTTKSCTFTNRSYNSSNIDCDGETGKSCVDNLNDWQPNNTTGICYTTQQSCVSANTSNPASNASINLVGTSPVPSVVASPIASHSPSPAASIASGLGGGSYTSTSPDPSPRITMPDTSGGTPVTGIFEVTAGTLGVAVILIVAGALGLLFL